MGSFLELIWVSMKVQFVVVVVVHVDAVVVDDVIVVVIFDPKNLPLKFRNFFCRYLTSKNLH